MLLLSCNFLLQLVCTRLSHHPFVTLCACRLVKVQRTVLGPGNPVLLTTLTSLAMVCHQVGHQRRLDLLPVMYVALRYSAVLAMLRFGGRRPDMLSGGVRGPTPVGNVDCLLARLNVKVYGVLIYLLLRTQVLALVACGNVTLMIHG
jgi:hypothetical protein